MLVNGDPKCANALVCTLQLQNTTYHFLALGLEYIICEMGQHLGWWCPNPLRHQIITSYDADIAVRWTHPIVTDLKSWSYLSLLWGRISTRRFWNMIKMKIYFSARQCLNSWEILLIDACHIYWGNLTLHIHITLAHTATCVTVRHFWWRHWPGRDPPCHRWPPLDLR